MCIFAAPLIWPWPTAFVLSMAGTMAASVVGFSFARLVARDWIASKIPARFRRYNDALAKRAFATVFFLRLVFWMPPLLHAFFGVSKVRFSTHAYASAAGYVLPLLLVSYFGPRLFELAKSAPPAAWIGIVAAALIVVGVAWIRSRVTRRADGARGAPRHASRRDGTAVPCGRRHHRCYAHANSLVNGRCDRLRVRSLCRGVVPSAHVGLMLERPILFFVFATAGCGGSVAQDLASPTGPDASSLADSAAPVIDAIVEERPDTRPSDTGGAPCAPIVGAGRFGTNVAGAVAFDMPGSPPGGVGATLLFPKGRVAGAPVMLIMRLTSSTGFASAVSVLDESLSASGLLVRDPTCANEINANLAGPTDGLVASVVLNYSDPGSDVLNLHKGRAKLCATDPIDIAASASARWTSAKLPVGTSTLEANLPLDPSTMKAARALALGLPVPITVADASGYLSIEPVDAFPPAATTIELDLTGVRDVLGRPVAPVAPASLLLPKSVVTSRTFDDAPPTDALVLFGPYASTTAKIVDGALWIQSFGRGYTALLGIGSEPGATTIRFRHRFACISGAAAAKRVLVVASDGKTRALTVPCSESFVEERVPLPGAQPSYLYIEAQDPPPRPCNMYFGPTFGSYVVDDIAFGT